ncbi:MAG: biotin/lipoyl-binding protein [Candidatus Cloacimonetes bacterium]|nr:biotin/lipoyl-binding protein [Candidatus Cloacimonadota bacterium]
MEYKFIHLDKIYSVKLEKKDDSYRVVVDNNTIYEVVDVGAQPNVISFKVKDKLQSVYFASDKDKTYLSVNGEYFILELEKGKTSSAKSAAQQKGNSVASPMPGLVVKIPVKIDEKVTAGTTLAIVEAMKMQNELSAPCDGIVKRINFKEGEQVDALKVIVELETR